MSVSMVSTISPATQPDTSRGMEKLGYSPEEAAWSTSFGRSAIYEAINSGALVARKFGRRTVILRCDLEAFLRNLPVSTSADARA